MRKIYSAMILALLTFSAFISGAAELETKFITYEVSDQVSSTIYEDVSSVIVVMPVGTDLSALVPNFTLSEGATAFVGETEQVSGTVQDFSAGAVEYKIVNDTVDQTWNVTAMNGVMVTFNVDMANAELAEGDEVYVTGSFIGWNQPGTGASVLMSDEDGDGVYTGSAYAPANSTFTYKYFRNASWDNGDSYNGGTDRSLSVGEADINVDPVDVWGEEIVRVTFNVDMTPAELVEGDVVYVTGSFVGWNEPGLGKSVLMSDTDGDGVWSATVPVATNAGEIAYKYFRNTGWNNGDPLASGDRSLVVAEENITIDPADVWGGVVSVDEIALDAVSTYPNPFNNQITITNLENVQEVMVTSLVGQVLRVQAVNGSETTVNTAQFKAGIYLVVIKDNAGNSKSIRVVKQ